MVAVAVPQGPKGGRVFGNMREFNRDTLGFIERCEREFGDVVLTRFLYMPAYFLFNPEHIEYVLATGAKNFVKAASLRSPFFLRLVGDGLVTSDGEFWRRQRRLAQPAFHRDRVASYGETMVAFTERALARWQDGQMLDAHEEMMLLTQVIVAQTLFSADVSTEAREIGEALSRIVRPFSAQATVKWILDNRLPTPAHLRFNRAVQKIDRFVYRIIGARRASGEDRGDLLSMLLRAQDEDGSGMTDRQLRDEVMTLFLAGHETTALALTWAWYLLARNPEAESALHAELEEVLGGRAPSVEDLPRLRYCEWVVKESLRLYPPAYAVGREAVRDCEVGGYRIPSGMQVFVFQWAVQRDARWYDEPEAFRPERWREEVSARLPKFAYFPFGGGPRQCIGNAFAMMEAVLILATIARRFRLRLVPGHAVELLPAMSLRPKDGIRVKLERR
ncbi:MAG TPA: cytochrome P450 [Pyrinomonadaceae bacterium]|jgi:cytochrome P450|nr:cytochrome P450 [Pyrinomonadaceae bacterium]